jgi:hypothetical protein
MVKKSKSEAAPAPAPAVAVANPQLAMMRSDPMVNLHFNLLNWPYLNFVHRCKSSTYLFSLRKLLVERHGRIKDLKICLNVFSEKTELSDEMRRIGDCIAEIAEEAGQPPPPKGGGGSTPARSVSKQATMRREDAPDPSPFDDAADRDEGDKDEEGDGRTKKAADKASSAVHQNVQGELNVKIYYDFKPFDAEDPNPILLNWNC